MAVDRTHRLFSRSLCLNNCRNSFKNGYTNNNSSTKRFARVIAYRYVAGLPAIVSAPPLPGIILVRINFDNLTDQTVLTCLVNYTTMTNNKRIEIKH